MRGQQVAHKILMWRASFSGMPSPNVKKCNAEAFTCVFLPFVCGPKGTGENQRNPAEPEEPGLGGNRWNNVPVGYRSMLSKQNHSPAAMRSTG